MNREKEGRHNQFLDKWLKEFGWLQTRGLGDDLEGLHKSWKEERVHEWMQKFPKIGACLSCESGGSQKFGKSVASAKN